MTGLGFTAAGVYFFFPGIVLRANVGYTQIQSTEDKQ